MIRFEVGDLRLTVLDAGSLWLDGGAMFGVVPKVLWAREREPDSQNRIRLAMNLLLVEDGKRRTLIDTGAGARWDKKSRGIYGIESKDARTILAAASLSPEQIDLVVCSHLHFDHAGGNTAVGSGGRLEPAFPNARYVVQRGELETARWENERTRASYRPDDFEPLAAEDRLWLVEGATKLGGDVEVVHAPGHTPHMQIPKVVTRERTVAFLADLVPTSSHVPYPYVMGYDLEPLTTLETKKRLLPQAAREGWYLVFEHDDRLPVGILTEERGRLKAQPVGKES